MFMEIIGQINNKHKIDDARMYIGVSGIPTQNQTIKFNRAAFETWSNISRITGNYIDHRMYL